MLKKILAASAAVITILMSGCSSYKMTEEDLELQRSLIGFWAADNRTGLNEFDENGKLTKMTAIQFTEDFHHIVYYYYPSRNEEEPSYVASIEPVSYTIEDNKIRVESNGKASYAGIGISDDGSTLSWITNDITDLYIRFSDEEAAAMGFPEYDPEYWKNLETASDTSGEESGEETGSDEGGEEGGSDEAGGEEGSEE